jgi:purine-binding chemotaxis protein CheW
MIDNQSRPDSRGNAIDWSAIRRRLEASGDACTVEHSVGVEEANAILKSRARALAELQLAETPEEESIEVLEFLLAGETYAVEASYIRETFPLIDFTPLFCTPPFVTGIINVRGRIVSIVDLRRFFDLPSVGLSNLNRVIIVRDENMEFGILADGISGMRSLPLHGLQPSLPTLTGIREELTRGVTGERLVLLDMGKILADRRLVVHEEVE